MRPCYANAVGADAELQGGVLSLRFDRTWQDSRVRRDVLRRGAVGLSVGAGLVWLGIAAGCVGSSGGCRSSSDCGSAQYCLLDPSSGDGVCRNKPGTGDGDGDAGDGDGDGDGGLTPSNAVDILLVIDNSGSMGEEQAKLAANVGALPLSPEVEEELMATCAAVLAIRSELMKALGFSVGEEE